MQCGGYWKSYTCKCSYKSLHSHVAGLHGCYSLLLTMVSVPPWLFDIYLWLFLWICKDNPSPLRSPHRPYRPWLHNRPLMFDLVPTCSNTRRGLRCWPVQWASLPAHDSMTPWHTKLHVLDDSTSSIQVLDTSWHFMTFRAWSLVEVHSTLDTSLFQLPDFQTQTKSHSAMCNVSSDKEIPATASHWTFKQVGSLWALVVSRYLYVSSDSTAACHRLSMSLISLISRPWPSDPTCSWAACKAAICSKRLAQLAFTYNKHDIDGNETSNDCKHGSTLSSQVGTKFFACLRLICSFYTCLSSRPPGLCLQNLPLTNSLWSPSYRLANDERLEFMARYISKFLSIAVESRDRRGRFQTKNLLPRCRRLELSNPFLQELLRSKLPCWGKKLVFSRNFEPKPSLNIYWTTSHQCQCETVKLSSFDLMKWHCQASPVNLRRGVMCKTIFYIDHPAYLSIAGFHLWGKQWWFQAVSHARSKFSLFLFGEAINATR